MAITYPLSIPTNKKFKTCRFTARSVVAVSQSPFTGQQQVQKHPGQWWEVDVSLPPMERDDAEEWSSFFLKLNGREGTFLMGDPLATSPRGVGTGGPQVDGPSQTGNSLVTKGWTVSQTGILKTGDYIQLGSGVTSKLYKVLNDADSNGSGNATLDIWPDITPDNSPVDNSAITISDTVGVFRLVSNEMPWTQNAPSVYGFTFAATEAL